MQNIFHHNSSGNRAFTGDLLSSEVLRAISLHPIKHSQYQYHMHNFFTQRRIMDLRQRQFELKRNVFKLKSQLDNRTSSSLAAAAINRFYLEPSLLPQSSPADRMHRHDFEFFTRSLFSPGYINPKRGLEGFWKRALTDTVRQLMDEINKNSIERGRVIDFKDVLYG